MKLPSRFFGLSVIRGQATETVSVAAMDELYARMQAYAGLGGAS